MGLDMYLERFPRLHDKTPSEISTIEDYLEWMHGDRSTPIEQYVYGYENLPPTNILKDFSEIYDTMPPDKYGNIRIIEQIGYWRKANAIHNWFVENCQDGEDDCHYHNEVTRRKLESLIGLCRTVILNSVLVPKEEHGQEILVIEDPTVAKELLPTTDGFFFGSTIYDECYIEDLHATIEICERALESTDFDTQMIYYVSSW